MISLARLKVNIRTPPCKHHRSPVFLETSCPCLLLLVFFPLFLMVIYTFRSGLFQPSLPYPLALAEVGFKNQGVLFRAVPTPFLES